MEKLEYQLFKENDEFKPSLFSNDVLKKSYGILSLNTMKSNGFIRKNDPLLFYIMIDISGSMSDILKDGRTKMDLIKFVISNMLHYLLEHNIYIHIKAFNDKLHNIVETTEVGYKNIEQIIDKVNKIRPMGATNLGLALSSIDSLLNDQDTNIPFPYSDCIVWEPWETRNTVTILLTDGEPTTGIMNVNELTTLVNNECSNHYIALGDRHNHDLMQKLGNKNEYSSNWFVNDVEHTGNVYGEIIFNELNRLYSNNVINVEGATIYDYYKGEFVNELKIGMLYSDTNKTYHLEYDPNETDNIKIILNGFDLIDEYEFKQEAEKTDFSEKYEGQKQYFRLCVQTLLCYLRKQERPKQNIFQGFRYVNTDFRDDKAMTNFNEKIITLKIRIKDFIMNNNLDGDTFMLELLKDINVMMNSQNSPNQHMFINARETTQGQQRSYNVPSQFEDDDFDENSLLPPPNLQRDCTSTYVTPARAALMRGVSDGTTQPLYGNERETKV